MNDESKQPDARARGKLPSAEQIRHAVRLYLDEAYGDDVPERIKPLLPPESFDPASWLMSDAAERDPADADMEDVRSFALRLGNRTYQHMKLRISTPPKDGDFLFSVDSHDAFLKAPKGSPDRPLLEELKENNARIAANILKDWDAAGLPTDRTYLRRKIREAREQGDSSAHGNPNFPCPRPGGKKDGNWQQATGNGR